MRTASGWIEELGNDELSQEFIEAVQAEALVSVAKAMCLRCGRGDVPTQALFGAWFHEHDGDKTPCHGAPAWGLMSYDADYLSRMQKEWHWENADEPAWDNVP